MKNFGKILFSTTLALIMLFSCFTISSVYAISSNNISDPPTAIYYFNDYYPTVTKSEMQDEFLGMNIVYDHQWVDYYSFNNLIDNEYFSRVATNSVAIIDIKTFIPDTSYLSDLFFYLKNEKQCKVMFVSAYALSDFDSNDFMDYVDGFFKSNFERLRSFLRNALTDLAQANGTIYDTAILIDGRLIDTDTYYRDDLEDIGDASPFLRYLAEELHNLFQPYSPDADPYDVFIDQSIQLLVHSGQEEFTEIKDWFTYSAGSVEELEEQTSWTYICAFGFWQLEREYFNILLMGQDYIEAQLVTYLKVYILEVDPFTPPSSLLDFLSDTELAYLYGEEYNERDDFFDELHNVISPSSD